MVDKTWLTTCATAGEFLYGQYTVTALKKMYESKKGCMVSVNDLICRQHRNFRHFEHSNFPDWKRHGFPAF